ncbi:MAG: hypothetical protein JW809_08650 [Pirellulales bacterium]|nr:hypothetical protein [Pirellulales bacterium]
MTRRRETWTGMGLGTVVAAVLLATSPGLPMVWDEGNAISRAEGITRWARRWWPNDPLGKAARPWTARAIEEDWAYTTRIEGHPAFHGIAIAAGRVLGDSALAPLSSARLGPILLFSLAAGALGAWLAARFSLAAGVLGVAAMLLLPRLFAHAHFASFDGPLTSGWILSVVAFDLARTRRAGVILFAMALGITLSTKATGWLAPCPLLAWSLIARDRASARVLALGVPLAVLVFFVCNPPLWHDPIGGITTFFRMNLDRGVMGWNIPTQFLGEIHHLGRPLPWYNTLLWTAISVPAPLLAMLGAGLWAIWRRPTWRGPGGLLAASAATLLVARALPGTPPHDGVRQFLPSFAFLAALAGVGAAWLPQGGVFARPVGQAVPDGNTRGDCRAEPNPRGRWLAWMAVVLLHGGTVTSLVWYAPQWLSYYNILIGGLRGATAAGMEPTYYWDGLDASVLDWLNRNTPEGQKIRFAAGPTENLDWLRRWGALERDFRPSDPGAFRWLVLQERPSAWSEADQWLRAHAAPAHVKVIRRAGWGPWRLDVPLVRVYRYSEYERAVSAPASPLPPGEH